MAALSYWAIGWAFAYGEPGNGFIGNNYFFASNIQNEFEGAGDTVGHHRIVCERPGRVVLVRGGDGTMVRRLVDAGPESILHGDSLEFGLELCLIKRSGQICWSFWLLNDCIL